MSVSRVRWAAIGAAVAITLGAGGIGLVRATSPDGASAYVPVTPCRLVDTRAGEFNVGPRSTPIGADETYAVEATGDQGECTDLPVDASGLQLNVTALGATDPTFVTVWGAGDRPNASNLNPLPGAGPVPNAVTTGLTEDGEINIYNGFGTVDVIVDVAGYYTDHSHGAGAASMHWLIVEQTGSVRLASPGLEDTVVFRPPGVPVGVYCLEFPDEVSIEIHGITGVIADHSAGVRDQGIALSTTVATDCEDSSDPWDLTVTTTQDDALANAAWRLLIPPGS